MATKYLRTIIACGGLQPEIDYLLAARENHQICVHYLDQNLHVTPDAMPGLVQEAVDQAQAETEQIVLGYGLCSNGIVGVMAPSQGLIVPKVHDCIALFLGDRKKYLTSFRERPGSYYLTPGWVAQEKDPLGFMENDYVPRVGRKDAVWAAKEELKHYSHFVFINTLAAQEPDLLRKRVRSNCEFFEKKYEEVAGSGAYFEKIVFGPYDEKDFIHIPAGEKIVQKPFLDM